MGVTKAEELQNIVTQVNILFNRHNSTVRIGINYQANEGYIVFERVDKHTTNIFKSRLTYKECKSYLEGLLNSLRLLSDNMKKMS